MAYGEEEGLKVLFCDMVDAEQRYAQLAVSHEDIDEIAEGEVHLGGVLLDQGLKAGIHIVWVVSVCLVTTAVSVVDLVGCRRGDRRLPEDRYYRG